MQKSLFSWEAAGMFKSNEFWHQTPPSGGHIVLQETQGQLS